MVKEARVHQGSMGRDIHPQQGEVDDGKGGLEEMVQTSRVTGRSGGRSSTTKHPGKPEHML